MVGNASKELPAVDLLSLLTSSFDHARRVEERSELSIQIRHRDRSVRWVEGLAAAFREHYAAESDVRGEVPRACFDGPLSVFQRHVKLLALEIHDRKTDERRDVVCTRNIWKYGYPGATIGGRCAPVRPVWSERDRICVDQRRWEAGADQ